MIQNVVVKNSQLVTATLTTLTVQNKFTFNDEPSLSKNNIIVYGIAAYGASQLATTPDTLTVVGANTGLVVTLVDNDNKEFMYQKPYYDLIRANNGGFYVPIKPRIISLTRCYVQITNVAGLTAGQNCAFELIYDFVK